jgi:hypothetical protein
MKSGYLNEYNGKKSNMFQVLRRNTLKGRTFRKAGDYIELQEGSCFGKALPPD